MNTLSLTIILPIILTDFQNTSRKRNFWEIATTSETIWFDRVFWDPTVFDIVNCHWCSCHFNSFHSSKYVFLAFVHNSSTVFIVTSIIRLIFGHANQPRYRLVSAHKATDTLILYHFFFLLIFYSALVCDVMTHSFPWHVFQFSWFEE